MQFASLFKSMCKEKGVTQIKALSDLGLTRTATQNWKTGMPAWNTLHKIADYFGVSIDDLVKREGDQIISDTKNSVVLQGTTGSNTISNGAAASVEAGDQLTDQEQEVLRIFRGLDMRAKNKAMTMLYELEDEG